MPGSPSSRSRSPRRTTSWSSTSATRTGMRPDYCVATPSRWCSLPTTAPVAVQLDRRVAGAAPQPAQHRALRPDASPPRRRPTPARPSPRPGPSCTSQLAPTPCRSARSRRRSRSAVAQLLGVGRSSRRRGSTPAPRRCRPPRGRPGSGKGSRLPRARRRSGGSRSPAPSAGSTSHGLHRLVPGQRAGPPARARRTPRSARGRRRPVPPADPCRGPAATARASRRGGCTRSCAGTRRPRGWPGRRPSSPGRSAPARRAPRAAPHAAARSPRRGR